MFSIYVFPRPPAVVIGGQLTTTTTRTRSSNNASVAKIGLGPKIEYVIQVTTTPQWILIFTIIILLIFLIIIITIIFVIFVMHDIHIPAYNLTHAS